MRCFPKPKELRCWRSAFAIVALVVLAVPGPALAASTVHVDPAGLCAGLTPCFTTIQDGVNNANPAPATVNVFPGDYDESVDLFLMGSAVGGSPGDLVVRTVDAAGTPTNATARVLPATGSAFTTSAMFDGDLSLRGFTVQSPDNTGITLNLDGSLELLGIVSDGNAGTGLAAVLNAGEVHVADSSFDDNGGFGVSFVTSNDVTFERVTADRNALGGASFLAGDVHATQSSFSDNKAGTGLSFVSDNDATLDHVTANGNFNQGATFVVNGKLIIRDSTFDDATNEGGLLFAEATDVTIERVSASRNAGYGANFTASGPVRITDSMFNENTDGPGLQFVADADATFERVHADGNSSEGAVFVTGNVRITDSTFNDNEDGNGLTFVATDVTIQRVSASRNDSSGAVFAAEGRVVVASSTFNDNRGGDGLLFAGSLSFEGSRITASGNIGNGLRFQSPDVKITGSRFERNQLAGVFLIPLEPSSSYVIRCSDFVGNGDGLVVDDPGFIVAEQNYWGSPSGPTHPSNPGGTGDTIRDSANGEAGNVDFTPFLTAFAEQSGPCVPQGVPAMDTAGLALSLLALLILAGWRLATEAQRAD